MIFSIEDTFRQGIEGTHALPGIEGGIEGTHALPLRLATGSD
jgi:hypothetical protein